MTSALAAKSEGTVAFTNSFRAQSPTAAMRAACARLLRECGIDKPPIPLKKILGHLGVTIELTDHSMDAEALLHVDAGRLRILIHRRSLEHRWQRARFTIAHECGHILLYHHLRNPELISSLDRTPRAYSELERLCDIAAAELLMPRAMLRAAVRENGLTPKGLKVLQSVFAVSRAALIKNVAEILPGTCLFTWRKHARNSREAATYRVINMPRYHPSNERPWLPEGSTARHLSPRIIEKAVSERTFVFEENLEIKLERRRWHGRGIVTFFPLSSDGEQFALDSLDLPAATSMEENDEAALQTLYLFTGDRRVTTPQQFLGTANGS